MKSLSRQRMWQLARRAENRCEYCARPAKGRHSCNRCSKRRGVKYRKPLKSEWRNADWNLSNIELAKLFKVTSQAVGYQRRKHAP